MTPYSSEKVWSHAAGCVFTSEQTAATVNYKFLNQVWYVFSIQERTACIGVWFDHRPAFALLLHQLAQQRGEIVFPLFGCISFFRNWTNSSDAASSAELRVRRSSQNKSIHHHERLVTVKWSCNTKPAAEAGQVMFLICYMIYLILNFRATWVDFIVWSG